MQCEKYIAAVGESDSEDIEQLIDEDYGLCEKAVTCCTELESYRDTLLSETSATVGMGEETTDGITRMQQQMQNFMIEQSTRQQAFIERQNDMQREFMEKQMSRQQDVLNKKNDSHDSSTSVKLQKLEIRSFSGDKMKWPEFLDSFSCSVHNNRKLSDMEKFSYLKTKVTGEANAAISRLSLCNENYGIAVSLLKDRFEKKQEIIDLHYHTLMNIVPPTHETESLRQFLDSIEKHLTSLDVMGENTNQNLFVSMIKSKIPKNVLLHLEVQKGTSHECTVKELREQINDDIIAKEHAQQEMNNESVNHRHDKPSSQMKGQLDKTSKPQQRTVNQYSLTRYQSSAETLVSGENIGKRHANKCRYCTNSHWSEECTKFKTIAERKKILKDSCYKCLKVGHKTDECRQSKICVHCGEKDRHHRSLCPKKFCVREQRKSTESTIVSEEMKLEDVNKSENVLVSSEETVIMQSARADAKNPESEHKESIRLLLDSGSQRIYVTEQLAEQLRLPRGETQEIKLVTFGSNKAKTIKTPSTKLDIKLKYGGYLTISANIVPNITGTIERNAVKLSNEVKRILTSVATWPTISP